MLVCPPLGWVLALGYRSLVANRLVDGAAPRLPEWTPHLRATLQRGLASSGVILTYLAPTGFAYWALGLRHVESLWHHWREIAAFTAAIVVFPPVSIPILPVLYAITYDWLAFTSAEIAGLLALSLATIFVVPAAFLQVAQHRRFSAALDAGAALRLIASQPRLYVEAWVVSLAASAVAVVLVPLTPWLLFWSYLTISHLFLQVLGAVRPAEAETASYAVAG